MIDSIKKMLGMGPKADYRELISQGAIIIDVRTKGEYASGHVKDSLNIPLDQLSNQIKKMKDKNQAIITCCASGMRSGSAKSMLISAGFTNVHNAGPWTTLRQYTKK